MALILTGRPAFGFDLPKERDRCQVGLELRDRAGQVRQVGAGQLWPEDARSDLGRGGHHPPVGADGGHKRLLLDVAEGLDVDDIDRLGGLARNGKANLLCRVGQGRGRRVEPGQPQGRRGRTGHRCVLQGNGEHSDPIGEAGSPGGMGKKTVVDDRLAKARRTRLHRASWRSRQIEYEAASAKGLETSRRASAGTGSVQRGARNQGQRSNAATTKMRVTTATPEATRERSNERPLAEARCPNSVPSGERPCAPVGHSPAKSLVEQVDCRW